MRSFDEILNDIERLKGRELTSLTGSNTFIITDIDNENKSIKLKLKNGTVKSRPFDELKKIYMALESKRFVHVDSVLGGSGSSRNQPETIFASLPYIDWGKYKGKKCIIYRDRDTHELGKTHELTSEEVNKLDEQIPLSIVNKDNQFKENKIFRKPIYKTKFSSEFKYNKIIFGAPGTGKSWKLNNEKNILLENSGGYERVTFYPDYTYSQFVGTYKPITDMTGNICYKFVPGPFMRIYTRAIESGKTEEPKPYLLIIEEINRANTVSVFGDVFQLLDRNEDGVSEYEIQISEDIRQYLAVTLGGIPDNYPAIKLPNNMFIWATMNSADQGVFPMDTAFKRRWDFEYIGINENESEIKGTVDLVKGNPDTKISWNRFRKAINAKLLEKCRVNEDKLLGPFFLSKKFIKTDKNNRIIDEDAFRKAFKSKVIMYLFEDAGRQYRDRLFDSDHCKLYSSICDFFDTSGMDIFGKDFKTEYYDKQKD